MAPTENNTCLWTALEGTCGAQFDDADTLYNHLTEQHVGRKITRNLCLECRWLHCTQKNPFSKRDHIVSHLKTHVNLKTFVCPTCQHSYKWLHDFNHHLTKSGHGVAQKMRSKSDARGDKRPKRKGETLHPPQLSQKRNSDPGFFKPVFVNNQYSMEQSMLNFSDSLETMSNLSQQEDMSRFLSVYDGFGRGRSLSQPDLSTFSDIPLFDHTDSSATLPSLLLTPATVDTIQHNFDRWETMSNHSSPGAQNSFGTSPVFNAAPIYSNPPSPLAVSPHMYAPSPIGSMPQDQFDPSFEFYSEQPPLFDKNVPTITLDPADNQDLFDVPPSAYGNYRTPSRQSMTSVSSYGAHSDLNEVPYENSVDTTLLNQFLENLSSVGGAD